MVLTFILLISKIRLLKSLVCEILLFIRKWNSLKKYWERSFSFRQEFIHRAATPLPQTREWMSCTIYSFSPFNKINSFLYISLSNSSKSLNFLQEKIKISIHYLWLTAKYSILQLISKFNKNKLPIHAFITFIWADIIWSKRSLKRRKLIKQLNNFPIQISSLKTY